MGRSEREAFEAEGMYAGAEEVGAVVDEALTFLEGSPKGGRDDRAFAARRLATM